MERFAAAFEKGIVKELEHALFLTRVIGVVLFLAALWFTPWPWKAFLFSPFFLPPLLVILTRYLPASWTEPDRQAQAAERRRIEILLHGKDTVNGRAPLTPRPAPPLHTR